MTASHRLAGMLVAIVAFALGAAAPAAAQDRDAQEVSRYVLTESGLAKFAQATRNISAVPGACERKDGRRLRRPEIHRPDGREAELRAGHPGRRSSPPACTSREYVVFMFSMMQSGMAAWAVSQPGGKLPPGVSQANVDFYKKHETAMAAIGEGDPCGDNPGDEEEPEE